MTVRSPALRMLRVWKGPLLCVAVTAGATLWLRRTAPGTEVYISGSAAAAALGCGTTLVLLAAATVLVRLRIVAARRTGALQEAAVGRAAHHRFLERLDHELKNPLTAIRAGLANIAASSAATEPLRATVTGVEAQTVRLERLVRDLRKLTDLADRPLDRQPVDIGELLTEAAEAAADVEGMNGREIKVVVPTVPWPLPPVVGDADLLALAVHNLVVNAVKYSGPDGTVELRGFHERGHVVVEAADTGMGIEADEAPQVWEELVRGRAARALPGCGLGLSLVRTIVQRHEGGCELHSVAGVGTVVRLRLPVHPDLPGRPGARRDVANSAHGRQTRATPARYRKSVS
ncbi:sensor histidine kinase [Streptomyces sp. 8N616]|uniref:sensor histidine kinase n=1 Tax=Streptomyces sp. 8N616 TaxID=3457414 RepID=UPI003FD43C13